MAKAEFLVVDTSAFIKNVQLQEFAANIITLEEVVNEVKSNRQLKRLVVLPYDLDFRNVFPENINIVTEFSKKTGDYPSLSATDLKVIALTYQLQKEYEGVDHIKTEPEFSKSIIPHKPDDLSSMNLAGFYNPLKDSEETGNESDGVELRPVNNQELQDIAEETEKQKLDHDKEHESAPSEEDEDSALEEDEQENYPFDEITDEVVEELQGLKFDDNCDILKRADEEDEDFSDDDSIFDDDDCGWITPGNVDQAKKGATPGTVDDKPVKVACLTTDFAMQNVLKQMGLNILSLDGLLIREMRTYILRCHACFKTTSIMTKIFCPKCGLKTLKKVAVRVNEEGKEDIYINFKRPLTSRGKRFPIPRPKGGKHSKNLILSEDQRVPQQRLSKKALQKTNALDPDYTAGVSPFVMRDTTSRSIMLGFHTRLNTDPTRLQRRKHKK